MRRTLLVGCGAASAAAVGLTIVVPHLREVPGPDVIGVTVPAVLLWCAVFLAQRDRSWIAAVLGAAGLAWCTAGVAAALPGVLANELLRLGALSLALVVIAVATLPGGTRREAALATAAALTVAFAGGAGATTHVRLLLGALLLVTAAHRTAVTGAAALLRSRFAGAVVLLQVACGAGLVALDPSVSASVIDPESAADIVAVGMAAASFAVVRILDPSVLARATARSAPCPGDRLGVESWLGDLLGEPLLRVTFPLTSTVRIRENGEASATAGGMAVTSDDARVIAWFDPAIAVDARFRAGLLRLLDAVGSSARLRAAQQEQSMALRRSRARLAEAALGEGIALERRLSSAVLPRLDAIDRRSSLLPDPDGVRARVEAARAQVLSATHGLAPIGDGGLADALGGLARLAADRVSIDVEGLHDPLAGRAPDTSEATAMWFAASEAVTNALKHAAGSHVRVRAMSSCSLEISDDGPGGADPTGSGLAGIRDRLAAVGGHLGVTSDDDGTRVVIEVPGRVRVGTYAEVGLVATTPAGTDSYGR